MKKPYARILVPMEDGTYVGEVLEFPGCYAEGDTPDEAIKELEKAAASWIEAALGQKQDIPEPLTSYGYSGKINLRLPKSIHKQAARFASNDDVSLNQFFTSAIAARVGAEELMNRLVERIEERLELAAKHTIQFQQVTSFFFASTMGQFPVEESPLVDVKSAGPVATVLESAPLKAITNA